MAVLIKNELLNTDGTPWTSSKLSARGQQPLSEFAAGSLTKQENIRFKVKSTYDNGDTHISEVLTLTVCGDITETSVVEHVQWPNSTTIGFRIPLGTYVPMHEGDFSTCNGVKHIEVVTNLTDDTIPAGIRHRCDLGGYNC